uniref:Uncharacterized protein n=1 Tax=Arundo donax TaxID=35708 RepID=A0A0A9E9R6_ARUDO
MVSSLNIFFLIILLFATLSWISVSPFGSVIVRNFILSLSIEMVCSSHVHCLMKYLHFFGLRPYVSPVTG